MNPLPTSATTYANLIQSMVDPEATPTARAALLDLLTMLSAATLVEAHKNSSPAVPAGYAVYITSTPLVLA